MRHALLILFLLLTLTAHADLDVTDYGAVGNARVLTTFSTVSNSTALTVAGAALTANDVGDAVIIQNAGTYHPATGTFEALITTLTGVTDATHATMATVALCTSNNMFGYVGFDNCAAFSNCMADAKWPGMTNIAVPYDALNSNYLFASAALFTKSGTDFSSLQLTRAGIKFYGRGGNATNSTGTTTSGAMILQNGGWINAGGFCRRGAWINSSGITNDLGLTFSNLVFDGGVQLGNIGNQGFPADPDTGEGIDVTHGVVLYYGSQAQPTCLTNINCYTRHIRGEMYKDTTNARQIKYYTYGSYYFDGDLTAINNFAIIAVGNYFDSMREPVETYVSNVTNASYFAKNFTTNCVFGWAFSGDISQVVPSAVITCRSNIWGAQSAAYQVGNVKNLDIQYDTFVEPSGYTETALSFSAVSQIGTTLNTNVIFANNICIGGNMVAANIGVDSFIVTNNTATKSQDTENFIQVYGNSPMTGWVVNNNTAATWIDLSGQSSYAYPLISVNNTIGYFRNPSQGYIFGDGAGAGQTNGINYEWGSSHRLTAATSTSGFYLQENVSQLPSGAQMTVYNAAGLNMPIYYSSAQTGTAFVLNAATSQTFYWHGTYWDTNADVPPPTYTLTVINGYGSGSYASNSIVNIIANGPGIFANWTGPNIANVSLANTSVILYSNTTATANFTPITYFMFRNH